MTAKVLPFKLPPEFGEVTAPWWNDRTVYLIGGGPSLSGFALNRLCGLGHCIGVNQSMFAIPVAAGVSIDHRFIKEQTQELAEFAKTTQLYLAPGNLFWRVIDPIEGAIYLRSEFETGLSITPDNLRTGGTSGYAALNLAALKRARRIVLLGYDYGVIDGLHHYHDGYPWHVAGDQSWPAWAKRFDSAAVQCRALGIEVINASPRSTIECFPKMSIEEALRWGSRS
jgi:hypothetical protein